MRRAAALVIVAAALGCGGADVDARIDDEPPATTVCIEDRLAPADPFADCVDEHAPAEPATFGADLLPGVALGPPQGGGAGMGGTDVVSLGCGGTITVHFAEPWPTDGPGVDFAVFENPFFAGDVHFAEPARVLVSDDGESWYAFDCDADGRPPEGCAGVEPVHATTDNGLATDPARAGGDWFDLAEVGLARARFVRLVDRTREHWGDETWCGGAAGGFDLDALAIAEAR